MVPGSDGIAGYLEMVRRIFSLTAFFFLVACGDYSGLTEILDEYEVEISPGRWLSVSDVATIHSSDLDPFAPDPHNLSPSEAMEQLTQSDPTPSIGEGTGEASRLSFEWEGRGVGWYGKEIPITLREHEGRLFMIGFNREKIRSNRNRLVFFALNEEGTGFDRIAPADFPKQIATQNMWLRADSRYVGTNEGKLDKWELLRKLDVDNRYFSNTLTAHIWSQTENNTEIYTSGTIPIEFVREYAEKYQPIPLPTLVRDE